VERDTGQDDDGGSGALLRGAGLRRTPVRVGVLDVLAASLHPLGVPQVLDQLPDDTDAVTVYRTLNTFTRKKLVHRVRGEERTWRYALTSKVPAAAARREQPHGHAHFVCETCGTVECLDRAEIPRNLVRSLGVGAEYAVHYPEVVLHGLCPKCHE
jgi:Fur family ferric uptake transcriptional regulator